MRLTRHLPRLVACAALAGTASLAVVAIPAGVASATGSATSLAFSGCTGTGANASNAGKAPAKGTYTVSTKTLKWSTTKTSVLKFTYAKDKTSKCKAISGDKSLGEYSATGTVTGGTAKNMIKGAAKGNACIYSKGSATIVKNLGAFSL
jgi:hypothetical protein